MTNSARAAGHYRAWWFRITGALLVACSSLGLSVPALALGLGDISVQSYLGQPLAARVALISNRPEELQGMTAGLASAESFQLIGLDRLALSVPLQFSVESDAASPYIQVRSTEPVNDPVLRFVVEVEFSNGRLLREYTLFLDPPSYTAPVPLPAVTSAAARAEPETPATEVSRQRPEPAETTLPRPLSQDPEVETSVEQPQAAPAETEPQAVPEPVEETKQATVSPAAEEPDPEPAEQTKEPAIEPEGETAQETAEDVSKSGGEREVETAAEPVSEERESPSESAADTLQEPVRNEPGEAIAAEPEATPEQVVAMPEPAAAVVSATAEPNVEPSVRPIYQASIEEFERYGPVERGETLWGIASDYVENSGYTVNQAMLAIQHYNPDAFANNNINQLQRGAILRLPPLTELALLSAREAMLEAMLQEQEYAQIRAGRVPEPRAPLFAERAHAAMESGRQDSNASQEESEGRLELVPPHSIQAGAGEAGPGGAETDGASTSMAEAGFSEEEQANVEQESAYLSQQIEALEAELDHQTAPLEVADPGLAQLQQRLGEERAGDEPEPPVAVVPPAPAAPWIARVGWWWLTLPLLLVAGGVFWLRRGRADVDDEAAETVRMITSEAEKILRALDNDSQAPAGDSAERKNGPETQVVEVERFKGQAAKSNGESTDPHTNLDGERPSRAPANRTRDQEEAVELDADDPETKLDLARAYISMGEGDAARELLAEVLEVGDPAQKEEAREMLSEI